MGDAKDLGYVFTPGTEVWHRLSKSRGIVTRVSDESLDVTYLLWETASGGWRPTEVKNVSPHLITAIKPETHHCPIFYGAKGSGCLSFLWLGIGLLIGYFAF